MTKGVVVQPGTSSSVKNNFENTLFNRLIEDFLNLFESDSCGEMV